MEVLVLVALILPLISLGIAVWILWSIRRTLKEFGQSFKEFGQSLEQFERSLTVLGDKLTILLYLEIRDRPDLLEKSPGLEKEALEAAERLGRKQLKGKAKEELRERR